MRLFRPCFPANCLYPEAAFRIKTSERSLCLTFDDGPDPGSTTRILGILKKYDVKAIFFCNGRKAERHHDLINLLKIEGHLIGNHGYSHLNGWKTSYKDYIDDVTKAAPFTSSDLFRAPFGRLTLPQYNLLKKNYRIYFWDVMPYDFDVSFGAENSLRILKKKIRSGSIIVLHDTPDSSSHGFLAEFVEYALKKGFVF
jgi:peptidoglycan/xylan/chitin deacetylase (PgdA/CDA1 family)